MLNVVHFLNPYIWKIYRNIQYFFREWSIKIFIAWWNTYTGGPWATRIWATRFWAVRIFGKIQRILSNAILYYKVLKLHDFEIAQLEENRGTQDK